MSDSPSDPRAGIAEAAQPDADEVLEEQLRLVSNALVTSIVSNAIGVAVFGFAIWGWSWPGAYVIWIAGLALSLAAESLLQLRAKRWGVAGHPLRLRLAVLVVNSLLIGTLWGSLATVLYEPDPVRIAILGVMLLVNLTSGTVSTAALLPLTYAFNLPLLLPFAFYGLAQPYELGRLLAIALLVMLVTMTMVAHDFHRTILRSIRMRQENRRLNEALTEQRIRERTRVLEEASRHKSEFLATMSHELRTPLNAIIGYSEMLQEDAQAQGAAALVPDLDKIHRAGRQLLELINAVLDLSKIEAGRMELHPETIPVASLLPEIAAVVEPLAARNGNRFEVRLGAGIDADTDAGRIRCDPTKLRQILLNLLGNACKFTRDGVVTLSVRRAGGRDAIEFEVADNGIGIAPERLALLFNDYVQADRDTARRYGGSGLGLALSRRLADLMCGEIDVRSEPGRGSTFTLRLPDGLRSAEAYRTQAADRSGATAESAAATAPAATFADSLPHDSPPASPDVAGIASAESTPAPASASPVATAGSMPPRRCSKVLVIDDDADVRELLSRHLARDGFEVVCARDGSEGLRLARSEHPDVVTLDVLMPGLDGWSVLSELKGDPATRDIPVVIVSMLDDRRTGIALGAAGYLTKPVERETLSRLLHRVCPDRHDRPVLLVDDDDALRRGLREMLELEGYAVVEGEAGRSALAQLPSNRPAAVILALAMREMDGVEWTRELRRDPAWQDVPVIVVAPRDLSASEHARLNATVLRTLADAGTDRTALLDELRGLVAASTENHPGGRDGDDPARRG